MDRELIFWATTNPGGNIRDREKVVMQNGRKVVIRHPQRGHVGDYDERRVADFTRSINVVRHEGHVTALVLTNAAAHTDTSTPYAQYQRAKARALGWYPLGSCPCAGIAAGEFSRDSFVTEEVRNGQPCERGTYGEAKPCKHALLERDARQKQHATDEAERMSAFKDPTQKMIEAGQQQAATIASAVKEAVAAATTPRKDNGK